MPFRHAIGAVAAAAVLLIAAPGAQAFDDAKYPNLKGQWNRIGSPRWDQQDRTGERAPLTPEYQAIFEANLADQEAGGQGTDPTYTCLAPGMPRAMVAYEPMEIVVTPETTYILIEHIHDSRRIFTDGRDWPTQSRADLRGLLDRQMDRRGRRRPLRRARGRDPRLQGPAHLRRQRPAAPRRQPDHRQGAHLSRQDRSRACCTTRSPCIDHALTRPWTVTKNYRREPDRIRSGARWSAPRTTSTSAIGKDDYFLSADGFLMPARKDQAPPDLRYFKPPRK